MSYSSRVFQTVTLTLFIVLLTSTSSPVLAKDSFALIINEDNHSSGSRKEMISLIARLFLKKGKMWPESDLTCRPFDRGDTSQEHQEFIEKILKMSKGRLDDHWAKMKQLRGDTPPRKINSTRILLRLIQKNKGAFGIVSREDAADLPQGIKVLFFF